MTKNILSKKIIGFTLIEIIIVIFILSFLALILVFSLRSFNNKTDLNNVADNIVNLIKLAQSKTLASEGAGKWGVYFNETDPDKYILFKGESYDLRDGSFDKISNLPNSLEFFDINITGGQEIVFDRIVGTTENSGDLSMRLKSDTTKTKTIYIKTSGSASLTDTSADTSGRIVDSRHVHFDYTRNINTTNEELVLTFEGGIIENVEIVDNIKNGEIFWEGEINVGGQGQKIKIQTHGLNNPNTLFSIHRDRGYNNKTLKVEISGDSSGYLIDYSADGETVTKTSIFASDPIWQ